MFVIYIYYFAINDKAIFGVSLNGYRRETHNIMFLLLRANFPFFHPAFSGVFLPSRAIFGVSISASVELPNEANDCIAVINQTDDKSKLVRRRDGRNVDIRLNARQCQTALNR